MVLESRIPVSERSQVAEARRLAARAALALDFDENAIAKITLAVSEAAQNLALYAKQGEIVVHGASHAGDGARFYIYSIDRGPGMDLEECMRDGVSSRGTMGGGLGAIRRQADVFDGYSSASGTILMALYYHGARQREPKRMMYGSICVPLAGELVCGDTIAAVEERGVCSFLVADGLGHGKLACEAASAVATEFERSPFGEPLHLISSLNEAAMGTRGAAASIAQVDLDRSRVAFAGVGNVAGTILTGLESRPMAPSNGTLGTERIRPLQHSYAWPNGGTLVMHTDGLATHWNLAKHAAVLRRHPGVIAAFLYREFSRGRDDTGILAARVAG